MPDAIVHATRDWVTQTLAGLESSGQGLLYGTTPPGDVGVLGSFYVQLTDGTDTDGNPITRGTLYGPKTAEGWPAQATAFSGVAGPKGETGATGQTGKTGDVGPALHLIGTLADASALPPSASPGDAYLIGTHLHAYASSGGWTDLGSLQGPAGPAGPAGPTGSKGDKGDKGDVGATGSSGVQGPAGSNGKDGRSITTAVRDLNDHLILTFSDNTTTDVGVVASGAFYPARTTASYVNTTLAAGSAVIDGAVTLALSYRLIKVATNRPARIRLYTSAAKQAADVARAIGTDPTGDHGVVLDLVTTTTNLSFDLAPQVHGSSLESTPSTAIPLSVENRGDTAGISITFTYLRSE